MRRVMRKNDLLTLKLLRVSHLMSVKFKDFIKTTCIYSEIFNTKLWFLKSKMFSETNSLEVLLIFFMRIDLAGRNVVQSNEDTVFDF